MSHAAAAAEETGRAVVVPDGIGVFASLAVQEAQLLDALAECVFGCHGRWGGNGVRRAWKGGQLEP